MNPTIPFLICHKNEDFRNLLKEMLSKMGFYHILDIESLSSELKSNVLLNKKNIFLLIEEEQTHSKSFEILSHEKIIILAKSESKNLIKTIAHHGLEKVLTFPFTSEYLAKKISHLI